jgi:hypothetical protein
MATISEIVAMATISEIVAMATIRVGRRAVSSKRASGESPTA